MEFRMVPLPDGVYGLDTAKGIFLFLVVMLALAMFVHLAARIVIDKSTLAQAGISVFLGVLLGLLAYDLVKVEMLGVVLGLVVFAFVTALVYRTKWLKGAAIGATAWVLWNVVAAALAWVFEKAN